MSPERREPCGRGREREREREGKRTFCWIFFGESTIVYYYGIWKFILDLVEGEGRGGGRGSRVARYDGTILAGYL
jgi:hypothetical protein